MEITEVRIKLAESAHERLLAFCSITIDGCFVVRDLKIIQGTKGPFVAMPSRKLTDRCLRCQSKNCLRAVYCGQCGTRLPERRAARCHDGRSKLYADIAHPINSTCREVIQSRVINAFEHEQVMARQPGYVCRYDDFGCEEDDHYEDWSEVSAVGSEQSRRVEPAAEIEGPHTARRMSVDVSVRSHLSDVDDDFGAGGDHGRSPLTTTGADSRRSSTLPGALPATAPGILMPGGGCEPDRRIFRPEQPWR